MFVFEEITKEKFAQICDDVFRERYTLLRLKAIEGRTAEQILIQEVAMRAAEQRFGNKLIHTLEPFWHLRFNESPFIAVLLERYHDSPVAQCPKHRTFLIPPSEHCFACGREVGKTLIWSGVLVGTLSLSSCYLVDSYEIDKWSNTANHFGTDSRGLCVLVNDEQVCGYGTGGNTFGARASLLH